ncbi:hypothetical protein F4779DRAFT_564602 [Xylariaceae sp. FL0662B]|nr:hypothetical protein F4779DRAFT_564602 [Xylariaceae sp. FL0662B]
MNNNSTTVYTPLEAYLLFQQLNKHGFINGAFGRISDGLQNTPIVREQDEYDAGRLSPESLQDFALQLLREEQRREAEAADRNGAGLSPNSRKRKLQSPPLPSLKEAHEQHRQKLPILVDRLYARFQDNIVRRIRDDERLIETLQRDIAELEKGERDEKLRQEQHESVIKNGTSIIKDAIPVKSNNQLVSTPAPILAPAKIQDLGAKVSPTPGPAPTPRHQQESRVQQPSPSPLPNTRPLAVEVRQATPDSKPQEPGRSTNSATPVLQHPQAVQGYTAHPSSTTPQPPVVDGFQRPEQRPETASKGISPAPVQSHQPHAPALKWEPPYQPPHQPPQPQAQPQAQPQPPHQPPHRPPHQPPHQLPHQPSHQTPVPSPRPPYGTGITRPPTYPSQTPIGHSQHPQGYTGGRQTHGQYIQQPRLPAQGPAPGSPPVLLPPQNAGQIPPSLPSLPLNAAPDGTGQQGPPRRPPSVPAAGSPSPNVGPGAYGQHQAQNAPSQTPVRPPVGLSATRPAVSPTKTPVSASAAQWSQVPSPPRPPYTPQHPIQPTQAPQKTQPQSAPQPYGSPYNPQAQPAGVLNSSQRPQIPPIQTPVTAPQISHTPPVPQTHTPLAANVSPHVVRGHGTKWVSTPTPATPRIDEIFNYFDAQSPAYEPLSPPLQPSQLPKTSPDHDGKRDPRKTMQKLMDNWVTRPRGRPPRSAHKVTPTPPTEETPVEPEPEPEPLGREIKDEESTPQALEETAGTVDEGTHIRTQSEPSRLLSKRKRQDSPPNRATPTPATHVLWTRSFNKISQSALDQIISHRHANMFAHPVKPKTAPGYFEIVLRPQDLKGIQKAITAGSKAAATAVATMPDIEPNTTNVWLPISVELVPPRGIVNIAQLERELVHMFANAIMYNPDPFRGFGPSFLKSHRRASLEGDGEDYRGYEVDENGVVKDTRSMFGEVEKLLSDLRNEVERHAPPPSGGPVTTSRSMSVAGGETSTAEDDVDEQAGDAKRRRVRG